jgi:hypothetical protein
MGYSLRVNQKQISTSSSPNRNLQFQYLAELRYRFQRRHLPIVSVDSKKRELVGNFKNRVWTRASTSWARAASSVSCESAFVALPAQSTIPALPGCL